MALRADYSVVLGQFHVKESCASLGFDESHTRVLYNPVVVPAVSPSPRTVAPLRAVALGRLGENKGSYDLVRAIGMLPNDIRANLRVTLAGDGEVDQVREFVRTIPLRTPSTSSAGSGPWTGTACWPNRRSSCCPVTAKAFRWPCWRRWPTGWYR